MRAKRCKNIPWMDHMAKHSRNLIERFISAAGQGRIALSVPIVTELKKLV